MGNKVTCPHPIALITPNPLLYLCPEVVNKLGHKAFTSGGVRKIISLSHLYVLLRSNPNIEFTGKESFFDEYKTTHGLQKVSVTVELYLEKLHNLGLLQKNIKMEESSHRKFGDNRYSYPVDPSDPITTKLI